MASPPVASPHYASACTRVGDFDVTYLVAGDPDAEETVVLLHGFGAWAEVIWSRVIPALAERYRVVAPDLIGFGLSSKPGQAFLEAVEDPLGPQVRFLEAFLDAVGVEKATLVGNSFGGGLALRMAAMRPERVPRLVLVCSMGLGRGIHYAYKALAVPGLGTLLAKPDRQRIRRMWEFLVHDRSTVSDDVVERNFEFLSEPGAADVIKAARLGVNVIGQKLLYHNLLDDVTQPTLVVWGKQDRIFPLRHARRTVERLADARLVVLDQCGHIPPFERPDDVAAVLLDFLAGREPVAHAAAAAAPASAESVEPPGDAAVTG